MKLIIKGLMGLVILLAQVDAYAKVYKWVDKDGKVHYSDKPQSEKAQEVEVKEIPTTKTVKAKIKPIQTSNSNTSSSSRSSSSSKNYGNMQSCSYIKGEMRKAQKKVNSKDEMEARFAKVYVNKAKEMLANKKCK
ncbi:DUF4124 domain-containing protein [Aliikangiella sp. G2MR2-5]|uniref:DUF4124 domain-containing protein n=1 Tax=Aliikangiella sp. G2MR2-5 TaxID=2788943 RepID=UPI001AEDC653|nr:DUF4124 domain-containing protein [Aliikangiella sp. G2MR2-5]